METSRDDFVIAVRSAFLKKGAAQRFSLLGLIIFSLILLSLEFLNFKPINIFRSISKDVIYRSSFIVSAPVKYIERGAKVASDHFNLYSKYGELKKEIIFLKSQQNEIQFLRTQNKELKNIIKDESVATTNNVVAKVLIDKKSPFLKSIILNKGSHSKILKGMAVVSNNNMIGRVVEVNYLSSRVLLISDLNSKIPVKIEPSGESAIMSGAGDNFAILEFLPKNTKIEEGNKVFTSGSDGIFNEGVAIGKIKKNEQNQIFVEFFVDLNQINFVTILNTQRVK
mgnify:CR=1 FL=1